MSEEVNKTQNTIPSTPSENKSNTKKIVAIVAVILVVAVILFAPIIPVNQTYSEQEAYQRLATYSVTDSHLSSGFDFSLGFYTISTVTVRNTDSYGGTFIITHRLYDVNGLFGTQSDSFYLGPGQTFSSIKNFDTTLGQDVRGEYSVSAPTVTAYHLVQKTRVIYKPLIFLNS